MRATFILLIVSSGAWPWTGPSTMQCLADKPPQHEAACQSGWTSNLDTNDLLKAPNPLLRPGHRDRQQQQQPGDPYRN